MVCTGFEEAEGSAGKNNNNGNYYDKLSALELVSKD